MNIVKPIISKSVFRIIKNLLTRHREISHYPLEERLMRAEIVADETLEKKTVSLNSIVEFISSSFKRPMRVHIVLPEEADLKQKKVSILSPIAFALLGSKEKDSYSWLMPSGMKNLTILKVFNELPSRSLLKQKTH
ncbi:MAG: transcription elongation factor [Bacteroidota bacterium]|jgi:regulator of nucleoside diphosphate kinase|nr:transcription elongation factor [Bacteroidota bacterium]